MEERLCKREFRGAWEGQTQGTQRGRAPDGRGRDARVEGSDGSRSGALVGRLVAPERAGLPAAGDEPYGQQWRRPTRRRLYAGAIGARVHGACPRIVGANSLALRFSSASFSHGSTGCLCSRAFSMLPGHPRRPNPPAATPWAGDVCRRRRLLAATGGKERPKHHASAARPTWRGRRGGTRHGTDRQAGAWRPPRPPESVSRGI